jgi:hypothetical protein
MNRTLILSPKCGGLVQENVGEFTIDALAPTLETV